MKTHIFTALTLGGPEAAQLIDSIEESSKKRYMHHYNFPPFSVGESGRVGGFNRRMVGHGDMDFKVAGTAEGVTAIQMDVKVDGIPVPVLGEALQKAKAARLQILQVMEQAIAAPRPDISPRAPKIITLKILPEQIGLVIGGGGKTINGIKDDTGVKNISE